EPSSKLTSSTARTTPSGVKKWVERFLTSSRFFDLAAFVSRCSRVIRAASSGVSSRLTAPSTEVRSKLLLALELGVERVPQAIPQECEAHQGCGDQNAGQVDEMGRGPGEGLADRDEAAPRGARWLNADADERQRRLGQDR